MKGHSYVNFLLGYTIYKFTKHHQLTLDPASLDRLKNKTFQHFDLKICTKEDIMLNFR